MSQIISAIENNKAIVALLASATVHAYQVIVNAGGIKNIWAKLLNGEVQAKPQASAAPAQTEKTS